ncbi:uncharacterized protein LOC122986414 [Thunnus albacares]|uniref:uncharacterized protein LOC122986414 n=1 Tax=Thunnus albacares TaxID=8236 RepID=UPI001CF66021|nr:uncharacterized protein LOC122986414 [Thunnus albacares]XP_044213609.1 uncharacterized protein LOC122986414 [Thunnus albacares]
MATGFQITSILLICFLSEVNYSSAFPRARSSMYPEAWQIVRETPQEGYGYGIRRPLQYIQALRQPHRNLQSNVHGQVQIITRQKPQESSLSAHSRAQIQNQPGLYHQTQSPYLTQPDVATEWTQEMSPSQPPPQRNYLQSKPRSFEFSLKVPFANFPHQNKDTSSITKGSALNSGGSDDASYSQLYRPSSVQIQSSFNSPSGSDGFSDKGSTDNPNGGKNAHDVSKPSFQLSFSFPIPSPTPSTKPASSNVGYSENLQRQGSVGFVQTSNMEPATLQSSSAQNGFFNSGTVQQEREHQSKKLTTFSTVHVSQHATPTEQSSQDEIPKEQSQVFPKPDLTNHPASSQPSPNYPLQSENVHSGYYNGQVNPSLSPSQYERAPSGHYSGGQLKLNGNNYGQGQTGQPTGSQFTFASEQYSYGQFKPSFGYGQNEETVSHPESPTIPLSQFELPSFGYPNREVAITTNYDRKGNVVIGQMDFSSSSPYQYSKSQSGQTLLPDHLTAFNHSSNFQDLSTEYQTQVRLPGQSTGRWQHDRKPNYTKLLINMEDKTDGADGQKNYFATPTHYDPYSGKWTRQNIAAPPVRNPSLLSMEPQSLISLSQHQITGFEYEQTGTERHDIPFETPSKDCVGEQHASNPQQPNAVFVPTNFDQQQVTESTTQFVSHTFGPSYGQYPIGQMQPTSDHSVLANYPASVNRIHYPNIYGLNH